MKLTLWDRIIGKKWAHVKTMEFDNIKYDKDTGKIYLHMYESNRGDRHLECSSSFVGLSQMTIDEFVRASELYNKRLRRWLDGRFDPEIPKYSEIGQEDTANALRGKV